MATLYNKYQEIQETIEKLEKMIQNAPHTAYEGSLALSELNGLATMVFNQMLAY